MFTGIVEGLGKVVSLHPHEKNLDIVMSCPFAGELKADQSVSHNGVCLTVTQADNILYRVTAIAETLRKTNLGLLREGDAMNLERSMMMNGRIDGHIVQGHVDQTAECVSIKDQGGSRIYGFEFEETGDSVLVPKGSICVNGVSLTVVECAAGFFSVAIIPYTFDHTNFKYLAPGSVVNLEFDILGKYVAKILAQRS